MMSSGLGITHTFNKYSVKVCVRHREYNSEQTKTPCPQGAYIRSFKFFDVAISKTYVLFSPFGFGRILETFVFLLFSHSVMSDSLQPHGMQHARLPCQLPLK